MDSFPKNFPYMDLAAALRIASSSPTQGESAQALVLLRDFYLRATGIEQMARLANQGREVQSNARVVRFPRIIEGKDYATALLLLADGARITVAAGSNSLHVDPDGNCIWGYDQNMRPYIAGHGMDVAAAKAALAWLAEHAEAMQGS